MAAATAAASWPTTNSRRKRKLNEPLVSTVASQTRPDRFSIFVLLRLRCSLIRLHRRLKASCDMAFLIHAGRCSRDKSNLLRHRKYVSFTFGKEYCSRINTPIRINFKSICEISTGAQIDFNFIITFKSALFAI